MQRRPTSRRFATLMTLAVLLLAVPPFLAFWHSDSAFDLRVQVARDRGYDGCTCEDCADAFDFGPGIPWYTCGNAYRARRNADRAAFVAASLPLAATLACLGVAALSRLSRDPSRCAHCGYELAGLPINRCPECGTTFTPTEETARP